MKLQRHTWISINIQLWGGRKGVDGSLVGRRGGGGLQVGRKGRKEQTLDQENTENMKSYDNVIKNLTKHSDLLFFYYINFKTLFFTIHKKTPKIANIDDTANKIIEKFLSGKKSDFFLEFFKNYTDGNVCWTLWK